MVLRCFPVQATVCLGYRTCVLQAAAQQIHRRDRERGQFAPTQARVRQETNHQAVAFPDGCRQLLDMAVIEVGPRLCWRLGAFTPSHGLRSSRPSSTASLSTIRRMPSASSIVATPFPASTKSATHAFTSRGETFVNCRLAYLSATCARHVCCLVTLVVSAMSALRIQSENCCATVYSPATGGAMSCPVRVICFSHSLPSA